MYTQKASEMRHLVSLGTLGAVASLLLFCCVASSRDCYELDAAKPVSAN